jgi:hypothetical protein
MSIKPISASILLVLSNIYIQAQVGIGTSSPSASAQLDVTSTTKGFLPPRVALTATNSASPVTSPATGLLVFNTATAGASPNNVTPGFYYHDGSKWQRIISQQPDATVSFNTANPNTGSPTFTPSTPNSTDYIYISSVDNSQWTYNGSTYATYTPPASTPWYLSGGTNDAGSNKTGSIYRNGNVGIGSNNPNARLDIRTSPTSATDPGIGFLGIGTTPTTANTAGAGAVRYNTTSGGIIQYSNGSAWNTLQSNVQKSLVSGYLNPSTYANAFFGDLNATDVLDVNNDFASNTFTAPRTGNYTFTVTLSSNNVNGANATGVWEVQVSPSSGNKMVSRFEMPATVANNYVATVTGAYTVQLNAGTTVKFQIYNSLGFSKTLATEDYNRFSIVEN